MARSGPLSGVRVIEMASYIAGPFCNMVLGDLGAEVIKVEQPPKGDPSRFREDDSGYSSGFVAANCNKKSIFLDQSREEARELTKRLAASADVFVTSIRPGARAKLGIDYETLSAQNERLIYVSLTGFGETPQTLNKPGFDTVAQAQSGLLDLVGVEVGKPVRIQAMLADQLAGAYAAIGALAALTERAQTGKGQYVSTSLLEACLGFSALNFHHAFTRRSPDGRPPRMRTAGYLLTGSDDLPFALHVPPSPERMWGGLVKAFDLPELLDDPRFASKQLRDENYEILHGLVAERAKQRPRAHWLDAIAAQDIPCAPVNTIGEAAADPMVQDLGIMMPFTDPWGRALRTVRSGVNFSEHADNSITRPPLGGENTDDVMASIGLSDDQIAAFRASGLFGAMTAKA